MTEPNISTKEGSVKIAVSEDMESLRDLQTELNRFLWSTELSYGYFLHHFKPTEEQKDWEIGELLKDVPIEAWYLNDKGRKKYSATASQHIATVKKNFSTVCESVIIHFNAAFEGYLNGAISKHNQNKNKKKWGPFLQSLSKEIFVEKIDLKFILAADISRIIRNNITHPEFFSFENKIRSCWSGLDKENLWRIKKSNDFDSKLEIALSYLTSRAPEELNAAKEKEEKNLTIDFFYAIQMFYSYNNLALQLEQTLFDPSLPNKPIKVSRTWAESDEFWNKGMFINDII